MVEVAFGFNSEMKAGKTFTMDISFNDQDETPGGSNTRTGVWAWSALTDDGYGPQPEGTRYRWGKMTLAAKIAAGVKVYVGGVLDESADVTSDARVLKVVSHDPTVKEGELITVVVVFSDGAVTTMSQRSAATREEGKIVTFTHDGANANSTDPTVNMNAEVTTPDPAPTTGSVAVALGLVAMISLAGAVAVSKKRK